MEEQFLAIKQEFKLLKQQMENISDQLKNLERTITPKKINPFDRRNLRVPFNLYKEFEWMKNDTREFVPNNTRIANHCRYSGVATISDLYKKEYGFFFSSHNIGNKSVREIIDEVEYLKPS